jgi:hypothetical protein
MSEQRTDFRLLIDRLSRREGGRLVGALTRTLGAAGLSFVINRAIALSMVKGPAAALAALEGLDGQKAIGRYLPYHMTIGDLEMRSGRRAASREAFARAHCRCRAKSADWSKRN